MKKHYLHLMRKEDVIDMYGESVMVKALCLLGILLGRENTYQYSYLKQKHPILKV